MWSEVFASPVQNCTWENGDLREAGQTTQHGPLAPARCVWPVLLPGVCLFSGVFGTHGGLNLLCVHRLAWKCTASGSRVTEKERKESWSGNGPSCWALRWGATSVFHHRTGHRKGESPGQVGARGTGRALQNKKNDTFFSLSFQPPKNSYVNYKVLQEQIKEKKTAKEEEKRMVGVIAFSFLS